MSNNNKGLIFLLIAILTGFITVRQFILKTKIDQTVTQQSQENLALEVSNLLTSTEQLAKEINQLEQDKNKLETALTKDQGASQTITDDIKKYRLIAGADSAKGQGATINISHQLNDSQLIDLINSLRNIGAEAISVNNQRLIVNDGLRIDGFSLPYEITAIGNKDSLDEALSRGGGILEQIQPGLPAQAGQTEVIVSDNLTLPAAAR